MEINSIKLMSYRFCLFVWLYILHSVLLTVVTKFNSSIFTLHVMLDRSRWLTQSFSIFFWQPWWVCQNVRKFIYEIFPGSFFSRTQMLLSAEFQTPLASYFQFTIFPFLSHLAPVQPCSDFTLNVPAHQFFFSRFFSFLIPTSFNLSAGAVSSATWLSVTMVSCTCKVSCGPLAISSRVTSQPANWHNS